MVSYTMLRKKATGKTVKLVNSETKEPVKDIRRAVSGENGYYSITLTAEQVKAVKDRKPGLALIIKDQDPLHSCVGYPSDSRQIDYQDILHKEEM